MRQKENKVIITFHTTAEAIAMEKACKARGVSGRLIPVPRQISAGCGLSWSAPEENREELMHFIAERGIKYESEGVYYL